ncbi:MAG: hypothetical protein GQ569_13215 [Methylococcaceae bacterium]|nr:hypothetical protein [Methylococcaceae bacterium]
MTKHSCFKSTQKSPIIMVGLFCLLCLLSSCRKETDPNDVTILFWTALAENRPDEAKQYSVPDSELFFDKKLRNAYVQTGKVEINYDQATVETFISRQSAASGSSFTTYLIRVQKSDLWKVDYKRTLDNIDDKKFKDLFSTLHKLGKEAKTHAKEKLFPAVKDKTKILWESVKNWFKKQTKKLLG